jgi:hypothetical protein
MMYNSGAEATPLLSPYKNSLTMNSLSHLAAIQANREIQHWGYGVEKRDGKWFAYEWERESELSIRTQLISPPFNQEWEAEQFLISLKAR